MLDTVKHTDLEGHWIIELFIKAFDDLRLDPERTKQLKANGSEFSRALQDLMISCSTANTYARQQVESKYGYYSGYKKPRPIGEQVKILKSLFPSLGQANESLADRLLPKFAEGFFAIPRWQKVGATYAEALAKILDQISIAQHGRFFDHHKGKFDPCHLALLPKTISAMEWLGQQQERYDFIVAPWQLGRRYRGFSVLRSLELMMPYEFGADPFSMGCILLTHPDRLASYDDLWIDCPGACYDFMGSHQFRVAPHFSLDGNLEFDSAAMSVPVDHFGSASGFLTYVDTP